VPVGSYVVVFGRTKVNCSMDNFGINLRDELMEMSQHIERQTQMIEGLTRTVDLLLQACRTIADATTKNSGAINSLVSQSDITRPTLFALVTVVQALSVAQAENPVFSSALLQINEHTAALELGSLLSEEYIGRRHAELKALIPVEIVEQLGL
jgi:hypothetical protein